MNEWFQKMRMITCIFTISIVCGTIALFMVDKTLSPLLTVLTAFHIVSLATMYKPELKKLKDKVFGDDDFKGGNFG